MKALIIEDCDEHRERIVELLSLAGYETFQAKNGKNGFDLAVKHIPDIILCDIMLHELDGYGVLYLLQKNQLTAGIPFIFMTAKADRADLRKGMEMGADDYLTKPFNDIELLKAIESRLKKSKLRVGFKSKGGDKEVLCEALKAKGKTRAYIDKQLIYIENEEPTYAFFTKRGKIKIYKHAPDGRELTDTVYQEGDYFGLESICNATPYAENAASLGASELILIAKNDFLEFVFNHQEIANSVLRVLSRNVQKTKEKMIRLAYNSIRKRVADALVLLTEKFGEENADSYVLKIPRNDIAAMVGTTGETISRMLADFKEEKLIKKSGNTIIVLAINKLRNIRQ